MQALTAEEIHSIKAITYDGEFWVEVEFRGKTFKCEALFRCSDETEQEMRDAGHIYIKNGYQWGEELWISVDDIQ